MEGIAFGLLLTLWGLSFIFFKDFCWEIQDFTNQSSGLVSERTEMWEIGMNFRGTILVLLGFGFIYVGVQVHEIRSQPVIPAICSKLGSDSSAKGKVRGAIQTGCAAARKKDYKSATTNFLKAADFNQSNLKGQNSQLDYIINQSNLEAAIKQMDGQLRK